MLTSRTGYVHAPGGRPIRWSCVVCLRGELWRAHYGTPVPAEVLHESNFPEQRLPATVLAMVHYGSDDAVRTMG
ncbi:hypothetical protein [Nocardia aurea]|uniref:hypothetical protein n=1 Tax=Nocardia aurea TaxID=2144174 RepID=UPI0033AEC468